MKVIHIVPSFPPSDFVKMDVKQLDETGHVDTEIVYLHRDSKRKGSAITFLRILFVAMKLLRKRPHVIHCHFLSSIFPALLVPTRRVVTIHESHNWYSPMKLAIFRIATRFFRTIFVSDSNRRYWYPVLQKNETVVYHAIDRSIYNPKQADDEIRLKYIENLGVDFLIFTMGANEYRRGLHLVIQSAHLAIQEGINLGIIIRGYGGKEAYLSHLQSLATKLGVPTKFITHRISTREMATLFASVDLFVRPTTVESFGIAVLEAQSCGTACIVTDCCSLKEVFGNSSLLFDPMDVVSLAEKMKMVLRNRELRMQYQEYGIENAKNLSWRRKISAYLNLYS